MKVKIFWAPNSWTLQEEINEWLNTEVKGFLPSIKDIHQSSNENGTTITIWYYLYV